MAALRLKVSTSAVSCKTYIHTQQQYYSEGGRWDNKNKIQNTYHCVADTTNIHTFSLHSNT